MPRQRSAQGFMKQCVELVAPQVEAHFGALPDFTIVSRRPDLPLGHPKRGQRVGRSLMVMYDIPARKPGIYYDPPSLMQAISAGHFYYICMVAHELIHVYHVAAEIKRRRLTHEMLVAERRKPYDPSFAYWAEGSAVLAELQVMTGLVTNGEWQKIAYATFGTADEGTVIWGDAGLQQRIHVKLASTTILASRKHNRRKPDISLVQLPFQLPAWLDYLQELPPYDKPFWPQELPYYLGAYHCCRWMAKQAMSLRKLLWTPVPEATLKAC